MRSKASPIQTHAAARVTDAGRVPIWSSVVMLHGGISRGQVLARLACAALIAGGPLLGCSRYPESEYPSSPPAGVNLEVEDVSPAPPGMLWRRDVDAALTAGLGTLLQHAELQPEVYQGSFVGFRITELRPPAWWQGVDLAVGDIITQVNGMPIEQPTEAHAAFESLRKTDKLTVKYLRSGQARELNYSIIDKPLGGPTPTP